MAGTIDEITINWTDEADGKQKVRELKKEVLSRGSWTTIMFMYQDLDNKSGEFGPPKIRIQRFQKRGGEFRPQSKFNISNAKQAYQIVDVIGKWFPDRPQGETAADEQTEEE
ncbi:MAG: hypothetical protein JXA24_05270 [Proteobacteria bacterium]|nr:hypothetical protein [Pseudomonadota bacterium]